MKKIHRVLICAAACAAALLLPMIGAELIMAPAVALAGFMAAEWGAAYFMPVLLCGVLGFGSRLVAFGEDGIGFIYGAGGWCLMAAFVLLTFAAGFCMSRKVRNRYALLAYAVILCLGIYLVFSLDSILEGKPPYAAAVSYLQKLDAEFESVLGSAYSSAAKKNLGEMISLVPELLMMFSVLLAEILALEVFLFGRMWYRVFRSEPTKMADFSLWRLPKSLLWGALFIAACCGLAFILKLSFAPALAWTMGLVFVSLFAVQGLSYLYFIHKRLRSGGAAKAITWVFLVLFFPYSALFLAALGIVEQITSKRDKITAFERQLEYAKKLKDKQREYDIYGYVREDKDKADQDKDNTKGD